MQVDFIADAKNTNKVQHRRIKDTGFKNKIYNVEKVGTG